jgi:hypothetical protein
MTKADTAYSEKWKDLTRSFFREHKDGSALYMDEDQLIAHIENEVLPIAIQRANDMIALLKEDREHFASKLTQCEQQLKTQTN